ncbi:MAG: dTDP-4-dehydrorhamnose 3,5-epimerase [Chromatiaceae bacterium]|nr:dTDP-4-dehydrorhamnose 3,5-epimerase [Chromatiaceae bacterium]MCP5422280.1 dTDP-4-dehydrorhamnose 3,5-epimerase [Chromatiaceae bacterium]
MSGRFDVRDTPIAGVRVVQRKPHGDTRGFFERLYCDDELRPLLQHRAVVQINHTRTEHHGTVRGMHFQWPPHAECKFVSCLRGEIFDVAVDVRRDSPTFLQWHAERLSADNHRTLVIPEGVAHGFQTLTDACELLYLHTAHFAPESEGGLHPQDPRLAIAWPLPVSVLSPRDAAHPMLVDDFAGVEA